MFPPCSEVSSTIIQQSMMTEKVLSRSDVFSRLLELELKRGLRYQNFLSLLVIEPAPTALNSSAQDGQFLEKMISLLRLRIRETDLIGTSARNTIAVVLLYSDKQNASKVASRLSSWMLGYFGFSGADPRASIGLGLACFPTHATDSQCLFDFAFQMLEKSKTEAFATD